LADGSAAQLAVPGYDDELLEDRDIVPDLAGDTVVLLLEPGTLDALDVDEDDLVGMRLTEQGLTIERVTAMAGTTAGAALAATLGADEPVFFDAAVWTACVTGPTLFTEPTAPLSELAGGSGLACRGE